MSERQRKNSFPDTRSRGGEGWGETEREREREKAGEWQGGNYKKEKEGGETGGGHSRWGGRVFLEALVVDVRWIFFWEGLNREDWLPASAVTHKICLSLLVSEAERDGKGEQTSAHPFISSSLHLNALCNINSSGFKISYMLILTMIIAVCFPSHHFITWSFRYHNFSFFHPFFQPFWNCLSFEEKCHYKIFFSHANSHVKIKRIKITDKHVTPQNNCKVLQSAVGASRRCLWVFLISHQDWKLLTKIGGHSCLCCPLASRHSLNLWSK